MVLCILTDFGPIHLLNTRKYGDNTCKYWDNTYKYWANTWKMCSPASVILASIVTILVSFEAILKRISVNINLRSQFQSNFPTISFKIDKNCSKTYKYCDNTCEYYTCRWTHFSSIGSILVSIDSILTSIAIILASIEQVNAPLVNFEWYDDISLAQCGNLAIFPVTQILREIKFGQNYEISKFWFGKKGQNPNSESEKLEFECTKFDFT